MSIACIHYHLLLLPTFPVENREPRRKLPFFFSRFIVYRARFGQNTKKRKVGFMNHEGQIKQGARAITILTYIYHALVLTRS